MSISHRSNRLKLVGSPSVEKLQNGRYKLVVTCSTMNSREDWYSANKDRIFPDFGSLQSAEMSIDGLAPRTGEAYADMRLTQVESGNRPAAGQVGDYNVALTYETLGSSFVQVKDDNTDYELNGLRRVTRTSIAESGTDYAKTVGTSFIDHQIDAETAVRCFLASYGIDDTDSFRQVQEVYVEAGTLSETLDNVGSQKAKVIETIGADPATPSGYSLASKQESDFEGFQTNRFTFLKNNVVLSESEDKVGSQLAIVKEVFNGTPTTPAGYLLANTQKSDVGGIPTRRYTFLKPSVLSRNIDTRNQGKLKIETVESFNLTPTTTIGGVLISERVSDVEGIPTNQYVYAEGFGEVSRSTETRNNGKLTVTTVESLGFAGTATGLEIEATKREEDGYTLFRNVFAEGNGEVSRTVETRNQGKLTITTVEALGFAGTAVGIEIEATTREQDGYTLFRNVFADGSGEVYRGTETRNNGKLTITTVEALSSAGTATGVEVEATTREQDGYTVFRNVFAEGQGEVSRTVETRNQGKLKVTTVESLGAPETAIGVEIESTTREQDGYTLFRNTFADGDGEVSRTVETRNQGKLTITTIDALGAAGSATGVEIEATTREQDGYTLFRNTFADGQGEVSRTTEYRNQGKLTVTTVEALGSAGTASGVEIEATTREQDGYTLFRNVFADGEGVISEKTDKQYEDTLQIVTTTALGTASGVDNISSSSREEDGYTIFTNVGATGTGEISNSTEERNGGALTINRIVSVGVAPSPTGTIISRSERKSDGHTVYDYTAALGNGQISVDSRPAPAQLAGCTYVTVRSLGTPVTPPGVLVAESETESDGYITYEKTALQGTIVGTKQTYKDVTEVTVAGIVNCTQVSKSAGGISGTIAVTHVTPPRTKTLAATVTVEVMTTPPDTVALAYDLGDTSCSVTTISMSENFRGTDVFTTESENQRFSGQRKSADMSARISTYPNCYLSSSNGLGSFSYISSYQNDSTSKDNLVTSAQTSTTTTFTDGTGSTSAGYATTGVVARKSRPILTALDGTIYFEVITWSV